MFTFETRKDGWKIIGLGIASFLTIFPLCAWRHLEIIERDLQERSSEALQRAGIAGLEISLSGRDVVLSGLTSGAQASEVSQLLLQVYGVRKVTITDPGDDQAGKD